MEPIESFGSVASAPADESARWFDTGLQAVKDGKVAVVVLCGGQGTRLGFDGPKGMYDIGLPSGKTLFQLQAERLRRVCALAAGGGGGDGAAASPRIPWYIMTSPLNDAATREFFASKEHFGIPEEDLFFFSQVRVIIDERVPPTKGALLQVGSLCLVIGVCMLSSHFQSIGVYTHLCDIYRSFTRGHPGRRDGKSQSR